MTKKLIEKLKLIKEDSRGKMFRIENFHFIKRYKGTISADHDHDEAEIIYFLDGKAELTVGKKTTKVRAPVKITIPAKAHHKLVALTDIILLVLRYN
ncbi:MAG: cupin domain-containing protein [archaeon]